MHGALYEINSGAHRAVIASVAATLLSWQVDDEEQLLTHPSDALGDSYQGKTILPWPNRIDRGRYVVGGVEQQTAITEPARDAALHGLMNWVEWRPVRHTGDRVVLEYLLRPQYGYPFQLNFRIEYTVDDAGVRAALTATNTGSVAAPFGAAYHPYIQVGTPTVDEAVLTVPARTYYRTNDRLIPIGKADVADTPYDFRTPRTIAATTLDTAFTDLIRGAHGNAVARLAHPAGPAIELWVDANHGYLQVYTDDGAPAGRRARAGITIEPMTCAPNAFNTGDGLIMLHPSQTYHGSWGLRTCLFTGHGA